MLSTGIVVFILFYLSYRWSVGDWGEADTPFYVLFLTLIVMGVIYGIGFLLDIDNLIKVLGLIAFVFCCGFHVIIFLVASIFNKD